MAEYIGRETVLMKLMQDGCSAKNVQSVMDVPAADVEPVVRCKGCKYTHKAYGRLVCDYGACENSFVRESFFCADGVKRKDDIS